MLTDAAGFADDGLAQGAAFAKPKIPLGSEDVRQPKGNSGASTLSKWNSVWFRSPFGPIDHVQNIDHTFSFRFHFFLNGLEHWECF